MVKRVKVVLNLLISLSVVTAITSFSTTPASAYAGTLENGNLAFAAGSGFDKGEACNYLPGFESGYDAWHFVLTSRGATFQQSPTNPAIAINLNFVFMRLDGSIFVIKSGAWVQTGKGAYTYTPVQDRIRMVQAGSVAQINGLDSGMRLSHTCPGTGVAATTASPTPTPSPTPTATASPSPTSTATRSPSPSPSPTSTATRSPSPSPSPTSSRRPSPSPTPSPTPTATRTPSPTPSPSATVATPTPTPTGTPSLRPRPTPTPSATQSHPAGNRNPLPTPTPTPQPLIPTPTPSPSPSASQSPSPSPSPSASATPSPEPTTAPPVVPSPPPIEDPKKLEYIDPEKPKDIDPQKFPDPPASPVVITQEPKYGTITENPNGTFTYIPTPQPKPVVDVVEFQYTNLSGATVVVRKEFLAIQKGDVPSIIQTGPTSNNSHSGLLFAIFAILAAVTVKRSKFHG